MTMVSFEIVVNIKGGDKDNIVSSGDVDGRLQTERNRRAKNKIKEESC